MSKINKLPEDIRDELHMELLRANFTDFAGIASMLEEKGYKVSKSAIHRYAVKNKDEIRDLNNRNQFHLAQLRISALCAAATIFPEKDAHLLKYEANEILKWALSGDSIN